jgi:hypothetical protein
VTTQGLVGVGLHRSLAKGRTSSHFRAFEFFDRLNQGVQATAYSLPRSSACRRSLHEWPRIGPDRRGCPPAKHQSCRDPES